MKLTIIPAGTDERKVISIRDIVKLEDQLAKGYIIERQRDGKREKLGIIKLPGFYDNAPATAGFCSSDSTRKVIDVVLDLRHNGGGILQAVNLAGLFITRGPVVQIKAHAAANAS